MSTVRSSIDSLQAARDRDGAALFAECARAFEPARQFGKERQGGVNAQAWIAREQRGAHFVAAQPRSHTSGSRDPNKPP